MKNGLVSIILLNYNGKQFNKDCINSILNQKYKNYEIIFVNNMSTDGSLEEIEHNYKREIQSGKIKIVKNDENLWFAGGNNIGVKNSSKKAEYIWLLNNDTFFDENCLWELIKGIESNPELGAVSSVILDKGREYEIKKMSEKGIVTIMNPFGGKIWGKVNEKEGVYYSNFLSGCSLLYKKSILDLPFFDFYKIYAEDLQLSWEIIFKGYQLGVCKDSIIHHFGSATMNKVPYTKIYLDERNLLINYRSFFSKSTRIKLFIPRIFYNLLNLILNRSNLKTFIRAKRNSFFWIERNSNYINLVKTRINNGKKISEKDFLSKMSTNLISDTSNSKNLKQSLVKLINNTNKLYFKLLNL